MLHLNTVAEAKVHTKQGISVKGEPYQFSFYYIFILLFVFTFFSCNQLKQVKQVKQEKISNPIVSGDYADPSIIKQDGKYYIYATIDPWGADSLAVMVSSDFKNWETTRLNWPTRKACTSPTSSGNAVWAPSVIKAANGRFYMYVSVGSEVWAGVSDHPLGPWKNAKEDNSPLIAATLFPKYHMIDAEAFIDDNKEVYLYWGSGFNWTNGHCFVVNLSKDMVSFKSDPVDVTPPHFFEGAYMLKNKNKYYLMYSEGLCYNETYEVRYSIGDTPYGPWKEGKNSPILTTSEDSTTRGPGHHTIYKDKGQTYILYHRIRESNDKGLFRQLAIDSLNFDSQGFIEKVKYSGVIGLVP